MTIRKTSLLTRLALLASLFISASAFAADRDFDGIDDSVDNCLWTPNPGQQDANFDGFGNACDADLDNDGVVTARDFGYLLEVLFAPENDEEADLNSDGRVDLDDFAAFLASMGQAPGPGAVAEETDAIRCDGPSCILAVAPGIQIEVDPWEYVENASGVIRINGDVDILTPLGSLVLPQADLDLVPNESLSGTTLLPSFDLGRFSSVPGQIVGDRFEIRVAQGRDLAVEIPIYDDLHYIVFEAGELLSADIEIGIATATFSAPSSEWRLLLDPSDPFVYLAGEAIVPLVIGKSLSFEQFGAGVGVSLSGRIPFRPEVPSAIESVLPKIKGDSVQYVNQNLLPGAPIGINVNGFVVMEFDPDGDGAPVFGDAEGTGDDFRVGYAGEASLQVGLLPFLELGFGGISASVISSYTQAQSANPKQETWILSELPRVNEINAETRDWFTIPDRQDAFMIYLGDEDADDYFRMATDEVFPVDTRRMGQEHGVDIDIVSASQSFIDINADGLIMSMQSNAYSIHPDVVFTKDQSSRLFLPSNDENDFEFTMETDSRFGGVNIDEYGVRITRESFQHWGRYVTPNYVYTVAGEYATDGPWLEGSLRVPLPYSYPDVERAVDIVGQIAEQELAIELLDRDYNAELDAVIALESALIAAAADLERKNTALDSAQRYLAGRRTALRNHDNYSCGTCAWYDAPCWVEAAACNVWKSGARPALVGAVNVATVGVNAAQLALTAAEAAFDAASLRVSLARNAAEILLASTNEARAALVLLRQERASLPRENGTIDATVALRITREGLTGTVRGNFNGIDFGEGRVVNDAAGPRACFTVPQTGEELCADL